MRDAASAVPFRIALLYPGDRAARDRSDPAASRFAALFAEFAAAGVAVQPAIYHDDFADEVRAQLLRLDGVLVWHNPIESGRSREKLDAMLADVAASGVFVSTHPDAILRMGTKDVLLAVRDLPFGSDVHRVDDLRQLVAELPARLAIGARVLKQHRGHSGIGVWRVESIGDGRYAVRHAERGAPAATLDLAGLAERLAPYFASGGHMIDQAWQPRMIEGMTRAYLVGDRVAGFGHQALIALHPGQDGEPPPAPGPRLYSDPQDARFQRLRHALETAWVGQLCERVGLDRAALPLLWDADFLLGNRGTRDAQDYVLCEINVSSVSPFPESAIALLVAAAKAAVGKCRANR